MALRPAPARATPPSGPGAKYRPKPKAGRRRETNGERRETQARHTASPYQWRAAHVYEVYQRLGGKRERAALGAAFNSAEPLAEYVVKAGARMAAALDQDGEPLQESVLGLLLNDWAIELAAEAWADATNEAGQLRGP